MPVKTINTLSKMLANAAKSIIEKSDNDSILMPDELAEKAVSTIDLSLFKIEDIIEEFSIASVNKVIKQTSAAIKYEPQMSLPTMSEFESKGISYDGGVILYKNARKTHLMHHIESVSDNQAKVNASAHRSNSLDLSLIAKIDSNADINNAGDAMRSIISEDNLLVDSV